MHIYGYTIKYSIVSEFSNTTHDIYKVRNHYTSPFQIGRQI